MACFKVLTDKLETCIISKKDDKFLYEITFVQQIIGEVNDIIQNFNNELNVFGFYLSKAFCSSLYTCAVLSTALYYYNQHKNHFLHIMNEAKNKKLQLVTKYIPWVVLVENDDENFAKNLVSELSQVLLCQHFKPEAQKFIENCKGNEKNIMKRSSIINELDKEVADISDERLIKYILEPQVLIIERFEKKWMKIKTSIKENLNTILDHVTERLNEIVKYLDNMNQVLGKQGAHSLTFTDELFVTPDDQSRLLVSDKKFCIAKLFHNYLIGEQIATEITTRTGSIYSVDCRWKTIVDKVSKPNDSVKKIFLSCRNSFETGSITYLGLFFDNVLKQMNTIKEKLENDANSFIDHSDSDVYQLLLQQVTGCQAQCPCCKRICDFDHYLVVSTPIGCQENRHRCNFGHQLRGMGGIRFEITNEASLRWCEIMKNEDRVITSNGTPKTWKQFKDDNPSWDFSDSKTEISLETRYAHIWKRIGKELCDHFGNGMKFVEQNSPLPINHFILILDHSGSMNERIHSSVQTTPWQKLLEAVQVFLSIRQKQVSLSDKISIIVFANTACQIYYLANLADIDIKKIDIPMNRCGSGTIYSAAFQMAIQTLENVNKNSKRQQFRQTIIFMTDGEPQDNADSDLKKLCDWREGMASKKSDRILINNFCTMALGNFNKETIKKINQAINGKLVNIEDPHDLIDAYAQVAELL